MTNEDYESIELELLRAGYGVGIEQPRDVTLALRLLKYCERADAELRANELERLEDHQKMLDLKKQIERLRLKVRERDVWRRRATRLLFSDHKDPVWYVRRTELVSDGTQ